MKEECLERLSDALGEMTFRDITDFVDKTYKRKYYEWLSLPFSDAPGSNKSDYIYSVYFTDKGLELKSNLHSCMTQGEYDGSQFRLADLAMSDYKYLYDYVNMESLTSQEYDVMNDFLDNLSADVMTLEAKEDGSTVLDEWVNLSLGEKLEFVSLDFIDVYEMSSPAFSRARKKQIIDKLWGRERKRIIDEITNSLENFLRGFIIDYSKAMCISVDED